MAEIHLASGRHQQALSSLEMALSASFEIRKVPRFHLLKGRCLKAEGHFEEALSTLKAAMELPGMKEAPRGNIQTTPSDDAPSLGERISIYVELAETYSKLKNTAEATKVMQQALSYFAGTSDEDRLTLANAKLMVERGEVDGAIRVLNSMQPDSRFFVEAKSLLASIYLKHRRDKKMYAQCYREIVERQPTVENCLLLGDAYMNIQEPEKAIAVYESALDSKIEGSILASRLGKAWVKTHDYAKATAYYESALAREGAEPSLRYDLADLYKKLQQYDEALRVITEALDHPKADSLNTMMDDVKFLKLKAQVHKSLSQPQDASAALLKARELQTHIISRDLVGSDSKAQREVQSEICYELADLYNTTALRDTEKALAYFNESVQNNEYNKKAMLALATLHLTRNDLNAAQLQCSAMLRSDIATQEATMMLADINFRRNSYAAAAFHFRQLLEQAPSNYEALMRVIEMTRRAGKLEESKEFFEVVERRQGKAGLHAGWHFCKGLYARYSNNPNDALREFNASRWDAEWGERSLYHMIEIYLNPDNETLGGEALEQVSDGNAGSDGEGKTDTELLAILNADKLLKELPQNPKSLRTQTLEAHALMATKQKSEIDRAIHRFTEILNVERDYVPALLGMAVGYMLLKQPPKARNQLKRISKMEWTSELADDFERSWLLLADIYIQGGKFDLATELLKRCLNYNRSCAKAWEYLGHIMEKEASYKDAAENYETAWRLEGETNAAMGFKLAFNHLKAKKFVEAIDVCHKVLGMYPDYPKMRKDILERARTGLRFP
ncbi:Tetratricopeptide repeat protein 21B [Rhizophlyctis rosea]|nr:Tetratricopeptide repeat protein 21B [Rhizophlyctis rosea]